MQDSKALKDEKELLDAIAATDPYSDWISKGIVEYTYQILKRHLRGNALEIGPAGGGGHDRAFACGRAELNAC